MRAPFVLMVVAACDQGPSLRPIDFGAFVPHDHLTAAVTPRLAPPEIVDPDLPPSIEPARYAEWFASLPKPKQKRIMAICTAHPLSFETKCGGIGPLHIPMPPPSELDVRPRSAPGSLFATFAAWNKSLTRAQQRYIDRNCDRHGREYYASSDLCGQGSTPLVIAFDDQRVAFSSTPAAFAFAPDEPATTDWPTAATPWLALDRDGDGAITSGAELFGNNSPMPGGAHATNGFVALAAFDSNDDGVIDARDPVFASLLLWADANGDRRSTPDELRAASTVLDSISLANHVDVRCDARDNCEGERAAVSWHDGAGAHRGTVVDVYLPAR